MEILDILTRESENTQQVYLYEEEGHWYAYERSAQLIKQLFSRPLKSIFQRKILFYECFADFFQ